jgi:hypothetical protein
VIYTNFGLNANFSLGATKSENGQLLRHREVSMKQMKAPNTRVFDEFSRANTWTLSFSLENSRFLDSNSKTKKPC